MSNVRRGYVFELQRMETEEQGEGQQSNGMEMKSLDMETRRVSWLCNGK
jgi:hypothetical protein